MERTPSLPQRRKNSHFISIKRQGLRMTEQSLGLKAQEMYKKETTQQKVELHQTVV